MYKPGGTLRDALKKIEGKQWVLPAIQREFVWKPQQVTAFFDSLMQGFPFGTFLFWKVPAERSGEWKFYDFIRDYHERDARHCPELGPVVGRELTAVLDGQQRLTALNVGLRGSMAIRRKYGARNNPRAYPKWYLFVNLLSEGEVAGESDEEVALTKERYQFKFMEVAPEHIPEKELWFRASDVLAMSSGPPMLRWLSGKSLSEADLNRAFAILDRLHAVIHKDPVVYYYEEDSPDLDRVLNIFIRLNSQGSPLSQSDLLHSIAVAQWSERDARSEISQLVDDLDRAGHWFAFTQNFVLKAGLMLADVTSVGFKVENFTRTNMGLLEDKWDRIRDALILTVRLVTSFGLDGQTIRAQSALLPIAYYLYRTQAPENFLTHTRHEDDRKAIRSWLVASLLKPSGIWGSGLDTLLTALREVIRNNSQQGFPDEALRHTMAQRGKSLHFSEEEVQQLVEVPYRDRRAFLLLSLLYPFVDLRNKFHVDHIYPAGLLTPTALRKAEVDDSELQWINARRDRLANLQLLDGDENNEKRKKLPAEWIGIRYPEEDKRKFYLQIHDMDDEKVPASIDEFRPFYEARRTRLLDRMQVVLNG